MSSINSKRPNSASKPAPRQAPASGAPKHVTVVRRPAIANPREETTPANGAVAAPKPAKLTYEKRMRELAPATRLQRKLATNARRVAKIVDEVALWTNATELRAAAGTVTEALSNMVAAAALLPDSFKPEREPKGNARRLIPGAKVVLHEAVSPKYDGILEPEEQRHLEVVSVSSGKLARVVAVKTASGVRLVLPRAHVVRAAVEDERTAVPSMSAPSEAPAST